MKAFNVAYSMSALERMAFKSQDIHDFAIELARRESDVCFPRASASIQENGDTIIVRLSE